jgi:hypothetical protein
MLAVMPELDAHWMWHSATTGDVCDATYQVLWRLSAGGERLAGHQALLQMIGGLLYD